jgi:hypothetical protein
MVALLIFHWAFKELLPGISIYFGFSHRVFQRFKTMTNDYTTVPTQDYMKPIQDPLIKREC